MKVKAYAAKSAGAKLEPIEFEMDAPELNEIIIKVTHCGICHTDIHYIDNDWEETEYPFIPGHEVVGIVDEVGSDVSDFQKEDVVGLGWQIGNCRECAACTKGLENCCVNMEDGYSTCVGRPGGFAEYIKVPTDYVFHLPKDIDSASIAPMMCGGITTYNPFKLYEVKPGMKVGVVGIGGLGHFAIKFAKGMGCEVYAFSSSPEKEEENKKIGADYFVTDISDENLTRKLDFIISTVPADIDWNRYIEILSPGGTLAVVGVANNISIEAGPLIMEEKRIGGGSIGSRERIKEMLTFVNEKNINTEYELFPIDNVNGAIEKIKSGKIRYRAVLDLSTI